MSWGPAVPREDLPARPLVEAAPILVYVAGPYTHGDVGVNVRAAVLAGLQIQQAGHVAFVPHYFHFAHLLVPHSYETWMTVDLRMLGRCDWFLRLPGYSPGADREQERARTLGLPLYFSVEACLAALPKGEVHDGSIHHSGRL